MAVPRQARNDDVVTAFEQVVRIALELCRTGRHPVEEDDGARPPLAVQANDRASFIADAIVIARHELR
jgi:hypothetical protein